MKLGSPNYPTKFLGMASKELEDQWFYSRLTWADGTRYVSYCLDFDLILVL